MIKRNTAFSDNAEGRFYVSSSFMADAYKLIITTNNQISCVRQDEEHVCRSEFTEQLSLSLFGR